MIDSTMMKIINFVSAIIFIFGSYLSIYLKSFGWNGISALVVGFGSVTILMVSCICIFKFIIYKVTKE